jgi:hypothetical protein
VRDLCEYVSCNLCISSLPPPLSVSYDVGAWIGEVNFLDGGGLKAAGAIATFVSQSQTRYLQWDNNSLRQLMTQVGRNTQHIYIHTNIHIHIYMYTEHITGHTQTHSQTKHKERAMLMCVWCVLLRVLNVVWGVLVGVLCIDCFMCVVMV